MASVPTSHEAELEPDICANTRLSTAGNEANIRSRLKPWMGAVSSLTHLVVGFRQIGLLPSNGDCGALGDSILHMSCNLHHIEEAMKPDSGFCTSSMA